jgi:hypothetical protein
MHFFSGAYQPQNQVIAALPFLFSTAGENQVISFCFMGKNNLCQDVRSSQ